MTGAPSKSTIGELREWDGGLSAAILHQSASIHSAVGRAAYQLSDHCVTPEIGRCKCSAIKILRYGWRTTPIPHPSFGDVAVTLWLMLVCIREYPCMTHFGT